MVISNTNNRTRLAADGALVDFDFTFFIFKSGDIDVYLVDAAGTATLQTITTDYTVAIDSTSEGGTITFTTAPATGNDVLMIRNIDYTQLTNIPVNEGFTEKTLEDSLDRLTVLSQQLTDDVSRSLKFAVTSKTTGIDFPEPEADKVIVWNSLGTGLDNQTLTQTDTGALADGAVTLIKMADLANLHVIGRTAGSTGVPEAVEILDEDDMVSDSAIKIATQQSIKAYADAVTAHADSLVNRAIGTFTRDTTLASGTQAITGLGFTPSLIIFNYQGAAVVETSGIGFDDGTNHFTRALRHSATTSDQGLNSFSIYDRETPGADEYKGKIQSFDADGFTINWTKVGTPTGTLTVDYIAFK